MIPIKTKKMVDEIKPDFKKMAIHNRLHAIISTHLFTFDTMSEDVLLYTRDFSPAVGIDEDPVTGSANGALAGYLLLEGILSMEDHDFTIVQGNALNRPGKLRIKTSIVSGKIQVEVGGSAVISITGQITL
jgi:PhzF family phenazine biosynthesis protein